MAAGHAPSAPATLMHPRQSRALAGYPNASLEDAVYTRFPRAPCHGNTDLTLTGVLPALMVLGVIAGCKVWARRRAAAGH